MSRARSDVYREAAVPLDQRRGPEQTKRVVDALAKRGREWRSDDVMPERDPPRRRAEAMRGWSTSGRLASLAYLVILLGMIAAFILGFNPSAGRKIAPDVTSETLGTK